MYSLKKMVYKFFSLLFLILFIFIFLHCYYEPKIKFNENDSYNYTLIQEENYTNFTEYEINNEKFNFIYKCKNNNFEDKEDEIFEENYNITNKGVENFMNNLDNSFIDKKVRFKNYEGKNSIQESKKILESNNIGLNELLKFDDVEKLTQDEINNLARKKFSAIQNIHPDINNENEQYYHDTLTHLVRNVYDNNYTNLDDETIPSICNGRIDLLWTYVNSTDPEWIKNFEKFSGIKTKKFSNRYRENGSFLFSMRSVFKNLKFIKDYWIVLASESQIPSFLNYKKKSNGEYELIYNENINESDKIKIHFVFHKDIFPDKKVLPTFNSNAIETVLGNIKGISECFLYLNDDFFIYSPLKPGFFIKRNGKINLYKINTISPNFSGNDWDKTIILSNLLLNKYFNINKRRLYPLHNIYFMRKSILQELNKNFKPVFDSTRSNRIRNKHDVAMPFLHSAYAEEKGYGDYYFFNKGWNLFFLIKRISNVQNSIKSIENNSIELKCFCMNDDVRNNSERSKKIFILLREELQKLFPNKLPFEK